MTRKLCLRGRQRNSRRLWLGAIACVLLVSVPASADLIINPSFTSDFNANFGSNAAAARAAWIAAASVFSTSFTDNITINITVNAVSGTSVFGQSSISVLPTTYSDLRSNLVKDAKSSDDFKATGSDGSVSSTDPSVGTGTWLVSRAEAKALGMIPSDFANDGTTTFGTGFAFTFSGPIVSGTYDFQGVAAHEISEVMGRIGLGGPSYMPLDLFSYSGPGTRVLGNGGGAGKQGSFSIDNGTTSLQLFNDQFSDKLDYRDWAPGTNDAFNQFSFPGVRNGVSAVDLRVMDVIGYDPVPEPSTVILLITGLAAIAFARRVAR